MFERFLVFTFGLVLGGGIMYAMDVAVYTDLLHALMTQHAQELATSKALVNELITKCGEPCL